MEVGVLGDVLEERWGRLCDMCQTEVDSGHVTAHVFTNHLRLKTLLCPVCHFGDYFYPEAVRLHIISCHPNLKNWKMVDIRSDDMTVKKYMHLRHLCFPDVSSAPMEKPSQKVKNLLVTEDIDTGQKVESFYDSVNLKKGRNTKQALGIDNNYWYNTEHMKMVEYDGVTRDIDISGSVPKVLISRLNLDKFRENIGENFNQPTKMNNEEMKTYDMCAECNLSVLRSHNKLHVYEEHFAHEYICTDCKFTAKSSAAKGRNKDSETLRDTIEIIEKSSELGKTFQLIFDRCFKSLKRNTEGENVDNITSKNIKKLKESNVSDGGKGHKEVQKKLVKIDEELLKFPSKIDKNVCAECNLPYTHKSRHIYEKHLNMATVFCPFCDYSTKYFRKVTFHRHLKLKHNCDDLNLIVDRRQDKEIREKYEQLMTKCFGKKNLNIVKEKA